MNKSPLIWCVFILAAFVIGCSSRPSNVLSKEDMAQLLADIHTGESVTEINSRHFNSDSLKRAFKESIYMKHGVTAEQVDSSMSWYGYNMEKYVEVYDRVIEILESRVATAQELAGAAGANLTDMTLSFEGDSVDVWSGIRYRRLASNMPSDFISFRFPFDRNWEKGDVYLLRSKFIATRNAIEVSMVAEYQDGTCDYVHKSLPGEGWQEVKLVLDSAKIARAVSGTIYYRPRGNEVAYVDSISLMRTRWNGVHRSAFQMQKHFKMR